MVVRRSMAAGSRKCRSRNHRAHGFRWVRVGRGRGFNGLKWDRRDFWRLRRHAEWGGLVRGLRPFDLLVAQEAWQRLRRTRLGASVSDRYGCSTIRREAVLLCDILWPVRRAGSVVRLDEPAHARRLGRRSRAASSTGAGAVGRRAALGLSPRSSCSCSTPTST